MSVNGMPQKRFRYFIETETDEVELHTDPKGWDGHEIGFQRSDDFGLNVENVVPLSFSGVGRTTLKAAYNEKSLFAKTKTRIERRKSDWTYEPYYTYKHDYSKFKDNGKFVEVSGLEDGLAKKFETYKDTEFEITLTKAESNFVAYTGESVFRTNQIQCGAGRMKQKDGLYNYAFVPPGTRAVREYSDSIAFTDSNGLPYETMTIRAIKTTTFTLKLNLVCQISAHAQFLQPSPHPGKFSVVKHTESFNRIGTALATYTPYKTKVKQTNNRYDWFNNIVDLEITLNEGELLSICYDADNVAYGGDVYVDDGADCYMSIVSLVESPYQNRFIPAFTFGWLIEKILQQIDPSSSYSNTIDGNPNYSIFLSNTKCIKYSIDTFDEDIVFKCKLSDVLKALNILECIGIDLTGEEFTTGDRVEFYNREQSYGTVETNKIQLEHDVKHQYNKITVGADTDDRDDDEPLYYPFICEKSYKISDTIVDNELDLMCPFMIDPTQIDRYIEKTLSEPDNKDECKFMVFACNKTQYDTKTGYATAKNITVTNNLPLQYINGYFDDGTKPLFPYTMAFTRLGDYDISKNALCEYIVDKENGVKGNISFSIQRTGALLVDVSIVQYRVGFVGSFNLYQASYPAGNTTIDVEYYLDAECNDGDRICIYVSVARDGSTASTVRINDFKWEIISGYDGYLLYRDHVINNFSGDANTTYNIPFTPKRILQKHAKYLAVSVFGSNNKKLEYVSTKILNSGISSKCAFETEFVTENTDFDLSTSTPIFLPLLINADINEKLVDIDLFNDKKYKYLTTVDGKTGETYKFWINSITFAMGRPEMKQLVGQLSPSTFVELTQEYSNYVCSIYSLVFNDSYSDYVCVLTANNTNTINVVANSDNHTLTFTAEYPIALGLDIDLFIYVVVDGTDYYGVIRTGEKVGITLNVPITLESQVAFVAGDTFAPEYDSNYIYQKGTVTVL